MKILILCTGNSCRSQMAEGFLKAFDNSLQVYSAGTEPSETTHSEAIKVMAELGIDLSKNYPKSVTEFSNQAFDYVITVCGGAKESCPLFTGTIKNRLHMGFEDPADAIGTEDEINSQFRKVRDEILRDFFTFYNTQLVFRH